MTRLRWTALVLAAATVLAPATAGAARITGGGGGDAAPSASDVGVSPKVIRIGVIADTGSPLSPGLFQGSVDSVKAFARYINKTGGIAGRKLVVDAYDSKLSPNDTRNAIITACQKDFALVGTTALFVNNVDDMLACKDATGEATGLPDLPVLTTEPVHYCSPVSFPVLPPQLDCATKDQPQQTYGTQMGPAKYYQRKYGKDLHGIWLVPSDLKATKNSTLPRFAAQTEKLGYGKDGEGFYDVSGRSPQTQYTPLVQQMKSSGSTYGESGLDYASTVKLRKEAAIQGLSTVKVWHCTLACYDRRLISEGGKDVEGEYAFLSFVPFEEAKANKQVANYLEYVGRSKADGFGAQAWIAGLLFRDVVNAAVQAGGANGVTRKAVLAAVKTEHAFDADGMLGTTDVGSQKFGSCFALVQVRNGKWVRVWPKKPASFDCKPSNVVRIQGDWIG